MGDKVMTPVGRVSFPQVFEAKAFNDGEPKFGLTLIFDEGTNLDDLRRIAKAAVVEKWGNKPPSNLRSPFRKGEEKAELEGYGEGKVFITATTKTRPGLIDGRKRHITSDADFYPGCYARITVTAYAYDQKGNRGVAFGLHNIQKVRDGESLGGRARAEEEFDEVADEFADADDDFLGGGSASKQAKPADGGKRSAGLDFEEEEIPF